VQPCRYPNVRLWFSGHFHLSHNYADSISVVGRCAFVQTGVIGLCNRDGFRHSRLLTGAPAWTLYRWTAPGQPGPRCSPPLLPQNSSALPHPHPHPPPPNPTLCLQ
jgi:hypothetical protein